MIVILSIRLTLFRIEKIIARHQLEKHASQRPDVGTFVVVATEDDLRGSILTGLNNIRVVVILVASIAHVAKFDLYVLLAHTLDVVVVSGPYLLGCLVL